MIKAGTILQDRYLIEKQIGTGGMGRVYVAVDQRFENRVAIKETFYKDEGLREAFEREARLLNGLHHPVLPHVSDYFTEGNEYFLVMEFIGGDDLHEILKREGAFPIDDVLRWSKQMLDALDYLHSQNPPIIHRDIKPQNLKITPRGDIILLDFGLAKLSSDDTTGAVSVFGYSRAYSPLEQIQGTGTDGRSDIFALAATVFHLLTGVPPIDVLSRAADIINGNPDPLQSAAELRSEIPASVAQILEKALSLNPSQRFASAKDAQQTLEAVMNQDAIINSENEPVPLTDSSENTAQESAEVKDFPALQSFANDTANASTQPGEAIESKSNSSQFSNPREQTSTAVISPQTTAADESSAPNRRANLSWLFIGVLAAVLFGGSLAVWQYAGKSEASNETISPATVSVSTTETQPVSESPTAKNSEVVSENNAEQVGTAIVNPAERAQQPKSETSILKTTPDDNKKPQDESQQSVNGAESPFKTKVISIPSRTNNSDNPGDGSGRARVVEEKRKEQAPLPDIERIFTGQSRQERAEQQRRIAEREERRRQRRRMRERIEDDDWELLPPRRRRNNR